MVGGGIMEYQPPNLTPASKIPHIMNPKYETLWVTQTGEFITLPTEEQDKAKIAVFQKKFNVKEWWAQKISKFKIGHEDYFTAFIKRDFSKGGRTDIGELDESEMWIGRTIIGLPLMVMDTRAQSETMGERIAQTIQAQLNDGSVTDLPVFGKKGFYSYHKVTPKTTALYKEMAGETADNRVTEYVYITRGGGRNIGEPDESQFWEVSVDDAAQWDRAERKAKPPADTGQSVPLK